MARRTAAEILRDLLAAGFTRAQAIVMTAIGLAESGGDNTAQGDLGLQNATWGPSYGTYQIRTLKRDTGSGRTRDIAALTGDDLRQAQAAYEISGRGADFTPWTVYTTGRYRDFLGQAQAAAASLNGAAPADPSAPGTAPVGFPDPFGVRGQLEEFFTGGRKLALQLAAAGLGLALLGVGLARTFAPQLRRAGVLAGHVATRGAL